MPRGYDEPARRHHRSRRRDAHYTTPEEQYPRSSRTYYPDPEPRPRGLNEDYYNPPPEEYVPQPAQQSRRGRLRGRSRERYGEPIVDDSYLLRQSKPSRSKPPRAKTQSRGRHKKYESDFSDDEEHPARPAKPSRRQSFLKKIGLGGVIKKDNDGAVRDRYDDHYRSRYDDRHEDRHYGSDRHEDRHYGSDRHEDRHYGSDRHEDRHYGSDRHEDRHYGSDRERRRGRSGRRSYAREPSYSPPRRRNTTRAQSVNKPSNGFRDGLKRTLTNANWQQAAGQAFRVGASTMYELRHDPSPWIGSKGVRVATAALGAGMMDAFTGDKNRSRSKSGGRDQKRRGKH